MMSDRESLVDGIRVATIGDLDEIMAIEEASHPDSWNRVAVRRQLEGRGIWARVLEADGEMAGFLFAVMETRRLHLINLAVHPGHRRQGIATCLLAEVHSRAQEVGLDVIELEVRETNLAAQLLYRSAGYRAVRIAKRHYGRDDAYFMRRLAPTND